MTVFGWMRWAALLVMDLCALMSGPVLAQGAIDIEYMTPALDENGFISLQGTRTPGSAHWNAGAFFSYSYRPLEIAPDDGDEPVAEVEHRLVSHVFGQMGLAGRGAVAIVAPFVLGQSGDGEDPKLRVAAVGDPRVVGRVRLIGESSDSKFERRDGPGLALQAGATLPIGHRDAFFAERAVRTKLGLLGDFQLLGAGLGAGLHWLHRFDPRDFYQYRMRDAFSFTAAFKLPIPWVPRVVGVIEVNGQTDAQAPFTKRAKRATTPVELDFGARMAFGDFALAAAIGAGLTNAVGCPDFRATLGGWYTPRLRDADRDGISDKNDGCPMLAEDFDGFEDADGCPDLDNDGDGIPDLDDVCPDRPADAENDQNEDGCPDSGPK
jgi:OmpA-OmpF porin, OOP family